MERPDREPGPSCICVSRAPWPCKRGPVRRRTGAAGSRRGPRDAGPGAGSRFASRRRRRHCPRSCPRAPLPRPLNRSAQLCPQSYGPVSPFPPLMTDRPPRSCRPASADLWLASGRVRGGTGVNPSGSEPWGTESFDRIRATERDDLKIARTFTFPQSTQGALRENSLR